MDTTVVILMFNGMTALDAIGPYEVLSKMPGVRLCPVGREAGIIECAGGLRLAADGSIEQIDACEVLVLPGGPGIYRLLEDEDLLQWIRRLSDHSGWTASVCTGSLLLGAAGILRGKKATTHWLHWERLRNYGAIPTKARYVIEDKIVTSAGVSAGIDMSLKLVQLLTNETAAQAVQLALEYDPDPPFNAGSPDTAPQQVVELIRSATQRREDTNR